MAVSLCAPLLVAPGTAHAEQPSYAGQSSYAGQPSYTGQPSYAGHARPAAVRASPARIADGDGMELSRTTRPVAPGARLTSFQRLESDKWLRAYALSLRLGGADGARADYLTSGKVSERRPVSELAREHDPGRGRRTVAALNADFFDINETGAPLGPGVRKGRTEHSPAPGASEAVGVGPQAAGRILDLYFEGTLTLPDGRAPLAAYNAANVPDGGIGAYNAQWGEADRALATDNAPDSAEVAVRGGTVVSAHGRPGKGPIPRGTTVLLGRGAGAKELDGLEPGDRVSWEYRMRTADGTAVPRTAVGGRGVLVKDGKPENWEGRPNNATAPRTAVGFSRDGGTMHVLTVDGRQQASGGVTLTELALMMRKVGAYNALNLDGGGSSTLLTREPGAAGLQLDNSPSDGGERPVPNGLALTAPRGSGRLTGFWVETAMEAAQAPTADTVPGGHPDRVFPGLTRRLTAAGYDETYGPARDTPAWHTANPQVGRVAADGVFRARRGGSTRVTAARGAARGATRLTVLGALDRIRPTAERVALANGDDKGAFGVLGYDADGDSAPVEPADCRLEYDRSRFDITQDAKTGNFTVRARPGTDETSGVVAVTAGGRTTHVAVTVGLRDQRLAGFDDADQWKFSAARATGSLAPEPQGHEGTGLRMTYDFTGSTATRAAYAAPPAPLDVPGRPEEFTLWIRGDKRGAWPSLQLKDAAGTDHVLRGPHIDWEGWKKISFRVPEGVAHPLRVQRLYLAETQPAAQYRGDVVFDELTARTPPDVTLPLAPRVEDRMITSGAEVAGRDWRFAVMSDAQFVAREPDGPLVRQARRTLREARAARPDFVVVNGDLVDEGSPADLRLARRVLEEELGAPGTPGAVPWYYVPGNHEVMGGSIDTFVREFGPAQRTFDHRGTRFLTLDTSSLTLRGGGYAQIRELRRQLDAAAQDAAVTSVAVLEHVPPRDPAPAGPSQLTDRMEANLLETWLSGFRARTGKSAAFIGGHTGAFHASRVDGVPYLINGNSGKAPSAPPGQGGFTGWSLLGVDRTGALAAQTRAHVDGLLLDAPAELRVGRAERTPATVLQGEGAAPRRIPVDWPLSSDWSGSGGLCVGPGPVRGRCVASYDVKSGTLTALRPGTVSLTVAVNGHEATRTIRVTR